MKRLMILFSILLSIHSYSQLHWNGTDFRKTKINPIIGADSSFAFQCPIAQKTVKWQSADVFNPAAIVKDGKVFLLYRAEDNPKAFLGGRTSRIGLAISEDGIHFKKHDSPVLYPDHDAFTSIDQPGGCEDPRVVETEDGKYVMVYTSWNGKTARLSVAISKDLYRWDKKGCVFAKAYGGKYADHWSKSGSIITGMKNGKVVAIRINGKYWMYWGELFVNLAWSDDLINWTPQENEKGELSRVISPRPGKFDSHLTECGPPAILTDRGIVLLYNGRNAEDGSGSKEYPKGTYTVGQVIFDPLHPDKVLERSEKPFMKPDLPHEVTGQYKEGTTFAEGLVFFKKKWFLYYGTADSFVGLAVNPINENH
ncbi:MAG: glycoside hydrolase family 130 protein [Chitinophagaceae bacterium]